MAATRYISSPIGPLTAVANDNALLEIRFDDSGDKQVVENAVLDATAEQLETYFSGQSSEFDLPLSPQGTDFQKTVWDELLKLPYGKTTSYHELSVKLGNELAIRAVAAANGANPIPIIIPCHRVIGSDGSLTGYAGGLEIKRKLLTLEGVLTQTRLFE